MELGSRSCTWCDATLAPIDRFCSNCGRLRANGTSGPTPTCGELAPLAQPSPRDVAVSWARAAAHDSNSVFIDTETTGLGPTAEIVDIAILSTTGEVLLDTFIRPAMPIPPDASRIHGIHDVDVRDAPAWRDIYPVVRDILSDRRIVVYNAQYDRGVINGVCDRWQLARVNGTWECAMLAFAKYQAQPGRRPGDFRWHKLDAAAGHFGLEPGGHRALGDTLACLAVVRGMAGLTI